MKLTHLCDIYLIYMENVKWPVAACPTEEEAEQHIQNILADDEEGWHSREDFRIDDQPIFVFGKTEKQLRIEANTKQLAEQFFE